MKYKTDPSGYCSVFAGKKVIAKAYIGQNGYSVYILQGMDRTKTIQKICQDCPEFAKANNINEKYYPLLFNK